MFYSYAGSHLIESKLKQRGLSIPLKSPHHFLAKAGEGEEGEPCHIHPHLNPPPSRGRMMIGNFHCLRATNPNVKFRRKSSNQLSLEKSAIRRKSFPISSRRARRLCRMAPSSTITMTPSKNSSIGFFMWIISRSAEG